MADIRGGKLIAGTAGNMNHAVVLTSDVLLVGDRKELTLHLYSALDTHQGTASIQGTIHPGLFGWNELTTKAAAPAAEMNETYTLVLDEGIRVLRVVYTSAAGDGRLDVGVS